MTTARPSPPLPEQPEPLLWSRREVPTHVGFSFRTFVRIEAEGNGPPRVWLRGSWWYRPQDVRDWIAGQVRGPR